MERFKNFFEDLYKNFNTRNIEAVIAHTTDNVKWANGMEGGYVHGHEGMRDYWTRQFKLINAKVSPLKIDVEGNVATIKVHQVVHDLNGHLLLDKSIYHYFHMEHDKIARFEIGDEVSG